MAKNKVKEKEFKVLMIDSRNKNHRAYSLEVVEPWISAELNSSKNINEGYDLEFAIDNEEEGVTRDIYNEFTLDSLSCGVVNKLRIEDGTLYASVRFKLPEGYQPRRIRLLESGETPRFRKQGSWIELTVPSILAHEVVAVDFR